MPTLNEKGVEDWSQSDVDHVQQKLDSARYEKAMRESDEFFYQRCPVCDHGEKRVNTVLLPLGVDYSNPRKTDKWPVQVGCDKRHELVCLACDTTYDPEGVVLVKRIGK